MFTRPAAFGMERVHTDRLRVPVLLVHCRRIYRARARAARRKRCRSRCVAPRRLVAGVEDRRLGLAAARLGVLAAGQGRVPALGRIAADRKSVV